jgi:peptide/nickel transport system substrate-binding protein
VIELRVRELGTDDPDANFCENYACGSPRNDSQYCNEEVMKMFDRQSQELDPKKRLDQVIAEDVSKLGH